MGGLFSSAKKDGGSFEKELEKIDSEITLIEIRKKKSPLTQKKLLGYIFYYALIIELLVVIWYYFHQKPSTVSQQVVHFSPLVLVPVLFYLLKWGLSKHFQRKRTQDEVRLAHLKSLLKTKLEERKRATAFDTTQNLLKKYGKVLEEPESPPSTPKKDAPTVVNASNVVQRNVPHTPTVTTPTPNNNAPTPNSVSKHQRTPSTPNNTPHKENTTPHPHHKYNVPNSPPKGFMEKFVDYLLSTGPKYGFALICVDCKHHNGFAPPGEQDMQFKCRVCGTLNQRGHDPIPAMTTPLQNMTPIQNISSNNNTPIQVQKRKVNNNAPSTPT